MSRITKPKTKPASKPASNPLPTTSTNLPKKPQRLHLSQPRKPPRLYLRPPKKPQRLILHPPKKPILRDRSPNRQPPIPGTMKIKKEEDTVEPPKRLSEAATDIIDTSTHTLATEYVCGMEVKKEKGEEEEEDDGETDTWMTAEGSRGVRVPSEEIWGGIVWREVKW